MVRAKTLGFVDILETESTCSGERNIKRPRYLNQTKIDLSVDLTTLPERVYS